LDIKKKAEEIRTLKLDNDKAEKALLESAESEHENGIANITKKFKAELKLTKGNNVDFVPTEDNEKNISEADIVEQQRLRGQFEETRRLEKKIHVIEHAEDEI